MTDTNIDPSIRPGQPDVLDLATYHNALRAYASPRERFHPAIIDDELLDEVASRPSFQALKGVPISVTTNEVSELVDPDRCKALIDRIDPSAPYDRVRFSFMPLEYLLDNADSLRPTNSSGSTFFFTETDSSLDLDTLADSASRAGAEVHTLDNPIFETKAGINLFQVAIESRVDPEVEPRSLTQVVDKDKDALEQATEHEGVLRVRRGGELTSQEEDDLWVLFRTRFQDISDNMPIRLEETEESTRELLRDSSFIFVYNTEADGTVSCGIIGTDNNEAYPWISQEYLSQLDQRIAQNHPEGTSLPSIFVPGLAAYKKEGVRASEGVLRKFADVAARTNRGAMTVRFECTDVSSLYIPGIVKRTLDNHESFDGCTVERVGQKHYLVLEVKAKEN